MIDPNDISTVRVDQLPPDSISLTDIFPFETLDDQTLKKVTFQELVNFMNIHSAALQFEIKEMAVTQAYVDVNFDVTGLGTNLCLGFAICNGQNGTPNLDGRTTIAFGDVYSNIGGFGGSKDAVVVAHSHTYTYEHAQGVGVPGAEDGSSSILTGNTSITGESGVNKNMQPYVVHLKMMKL